MDNDIDYSSPDRNPTPKLFYETEQKRALQVSIVADQRKILRPIAGSNEAHSTHTPHEESIINIQLPYDMHTPTEPEL